VKYNTINTCKRVCPHYWILRFNTTYVISDRPLTKKEEAMDDNKGFSGVPILGSVMMFAFVLLRFYGVLPPVDHTMPVWVEVGETAFLLIMSFFYIGYIIRLLKKTQTIGMALLGLYFISIGAAIVIVAFAESYSHYGLTLTAGNQNGDLTPSDYLYFSIITWTTVGYGDLVPTRASRPFAAAEALFGYLYMAVYIGYMLNVLTFFSEYDFEKLRRRRPPASSVSDSPPTDPVS
jgi:hypothetical protein